MLLETYCKSSQVGWYCESVNYILFMFYRLFFLRCIKCPHFTKIAPCAGKQKKCTWISIRSFRVTSWPVEGVCHTGARVNLTGRRATLWSWHNQCILMSDNALRVFCPIRHVHPGFINRNLSGNLFHILLLSDSVDCREWDASSEPNPAPRLPTIHSRYTLTFEAEPTI